MNNTEELMGAEEGGIALEVRDGLFVLGPAAGPEEALKADLRYEWDAL